MELWTAAITDAGIKRPSNQDAVMIKVVQSPYGRIALAVICDGMGGLSNGELASATMINFLDQWFQKDLSSALSDQNWEIAICESLRIVAENADIRLKEYSVEIGQQMGTTVCVLLIIDARYYIFHVGDTRVYLNNGWSFRQLTKDHTYVQQEIDKGRMTVQEAENSPHKSILSQCVGAGEKMIPDFNSGIIEKNSVFLICSDGFRHVLSFGELQKETTPQMILSEDVMNDKLDFLVETVKRRREQDNISAILIKAF